MRKPSRLGRGLASILSINEELEIQKMIPVDEIVPNPFQPRRNFGEDELNELAESIKQFGVLHPIIVREKDGKYEIVAGERRWRAAKIAGLTRIPAVIKDVSDRDTLVIALVENIQREDLNTVEKARAIKKLKDELSLTDEELANYLGKTRSTITNTLRLLNLPMEVLEMLAGGKISEGHARVLLRLNSPSETIRWARKVVEEGLSVRELENLISPKHQKKAEDEMVIQNILRKMESKGFRSKVRRSKRFITLEIKFSSQDELDRFVDMVPEFKKDVEKGIT